MPVSARVVTGIAAIAAVAAAAWWFTTPPQPPAPPAETTQPAVAAAPPAPVLPPAPQPSSPASGAVLAATASAPASRDLARLQREIQQAQSSDRPGLAGKAARNIELCQLTERSREAMVERLRQRGGPEVETVISDMVASCQAVDAASRAQLPTLLRRSVAEGDTGSAARLVRALGAAFDPAAEADAVAALRRDAWACDMASQAALASLTRRHPQLLSPEERGAVWALEGARFRAGFEAFARQAGAASQPQLAAMAELSRARFEPPPGADAAEVTRLVADVQGRCPPALQPGR